uniref:Uncharacterized protein n=1 Tax=Plectus sambesii TaxID=2011161 RepID=A0A914XMT7_9BILA
MKSCVWMFVVAVVLLAYGANEIDAQYYPNYSPGYAYLGLFNYPVVVPAYPSRTKRSALFQAIQRAYRTR